MTLKFHYPPEFERLWKAHPVGVKKPAYDAWKKLRLTADETLELVAHLDRRHREDAKWIEGKYVPHLATFLNQRRWEDDYKTVRSAGFGARANRSQGEGWRALGFESFEDYVAGRMH